MAEISNRRARTKDWASDGRKAAGIVFGTITNLSTAAQSFALLVLAGKCAIFAALSPSVRNPLLTASTANITLDGLLKIAHFPALREHFRAGFSQIVASRQREWERLATEGYLVFDYKEFLRVRVGTQDW
jgi:hypothetical protein